MAATGEEFLEYLQLDSIYSSHLISYSSGEGPVLIVSQKKNGYHPPAVYIQGENHDRLFLSSSESKQIAIFHV